MSTTTRQDKAWMQRGFTDGERPFWQEALDRYTTIPASKSVQAAEVIGAMAGSWASSYMLGSSVLGDQNALSPPQPQEVVNRLGLPGHPEINFRPYDWGTNRFSTKGPSLLGHPISFSVYGPTLKWAYTEHQWRVDTSGANDLLIVDDITALSTTGAPAAFVADMSDIYGADILSHVADGLYLVVSATGSEGGLNNIGGGAPGTGGLGDGLVGQDASGDLRIPATPGDSTSKYEIFRITAIDLTGGGTGLGQITLDENKRLSDYFDFTAAGSDYDAIRAVMIIKPVVTRVVAVPGSSSSGVNGEEQVFAVVPPAHALQSDYQPYYDNWVNTGLFDPWLEYINPVTAVGTSGTYFDEVPLPIPRPIRRGEAGLQGETGFPSIAIEYGFWVIHTDAGELNTEDEGRILRIYQAEQIGGAQLQTSALLPDGTGMGLAPTGQTGLDSLLGYYEVVDTDGGSGTVTLRRIPEVNPETGLPFYGCCQLLETYAGVGRFRLLWTLHEPIEHLWTGANPDIQDIGSARLTNIIDPAWAGTSLKDELSVGSLSRADKAIFDTSTSNGGASGSNANPGSLLDLGFRAVLYPGKVSGGDVVPDFDNPITSRELVLDTDSEGPQFYEIDYSAGLIYLSHAAKAGAGCELCPDATVLTANNNAPGMMTFFVACVPYSREPGQLGASPRVSAGAVSYIDSCNEWAHQAGAMSFPYNYPLATPQTITCGSVLSGGSAELYLADRLTAADIPPSGFVTLLQGSNLNADPAFTEGEDRWVSTFGYTRVNYEDAGNSNHTTLQGIWGGGVQGGTYVVPAFPNEAIAVVHRQAVMPNKGDGTVGTDLRADGTYGMSWRAKSLHFEAGFVEATVDGGLLIRVRDPEATAAVAALNDLFSNEIISGGDLSDGGSVAGYAIVDVAEAVVLNRGRRQVVPPPAFDLLVPTAEDNVYIYLDCSDPDASCPTHAWTDRLPLPNDHDILLGRVEHDGAATPAITDIIELQHYLLDVDERVDLIVGNYYTDSTGPTRAAPHFRRISEAITFLGETMNPASVGGTGSSQYGKQWRILVNGYVDESSLTSPIVIPTGGIVIEGAARQRDSAYTRILWDGDFSLFDLNAQNDLVFRDLSFWYSEGSSPGATPNRAVFYNDGGTVERLHISGCEFYGSRAHAFLLVRGPSTATPALQDSTLEDCWSSTHDSFVQILTSDDASASVARNVRIHRNYATTATGGIPTPAVGAAEEEAAAVYIQAGQDCSLRDNYFYKFYRGIRFQGINPLSNQGALVENNRITFTEYSGLILERGEHISVLGNWMEDIYNAPGLDAEVGGPKAAVYLDGNTDSCSVWRNYVALDPAASPLDYAIHLGIGNYNNVRANEVTLGLISTGGTYDTIAENISADGLESRTTATSCYFLNNVADTSALFVFDGNGHRVWGNRLTDLTVQNSSAAIISENIILGDTTIEGDGNHIATNILGNSVIITGDNWILQGNIDLAGAIYVSGTECSVQNNTFNVLVCATARDAALQSSIVEGNFLSTLATAYTFGASQVSPGGVCDEVTFIGNKISSGVSCAWESGTFVANSDTLYFMSNQIQTFSGATENGGAVDTLFFMDNVVLDYFRAVKANSTAPSPGGAPSSVWLQGNYFAKEVVLAAGGNSTNLSGAAVATARVQFNTIGTDLIAASAGQSSAGTNNGVGVLTLSVEDCRVGDDIILAEGAGTSASGNGGAVNQARVCRCTIGGNLVAASAGTSGTVNGAGVSALTADSNVLKLSSALKGNIVLAEGTSVGFDNGGVSTDPYGMLIQNNYCRQIVAAQAGSGTGNAGYVAADIVIDDNFVDEFIICASYGLTAAKVTGSVTVRNNTFPMSKNAGAIITADGVKGSSVAAASQCNDVIIEGNAFQVLATANAGVISVGTVYQVTGNRCRCIVSTADGLVSQPPGNPEGSAFQVDPDAASGNGVCLGNRVSLGTANEIFGAAAPGPAAAGGGIIANTRIP